MHIRHECIDLTNVVYDRPVAIQKYGDKRGREEKLRHIVHCLSMIEIRPGQNLEIQTSKHNQTADILQTFLKAPTGQVSEFGKIEG